MQNDGEQQQPKLGKPLSTWTLSPCLFGLLLIPIGGSLWFQLSPAQLPVLKIETPRPALLFSTYLYHHGEDPIEPTSQLKTEFRFRNDGEFPVHIERVERSCGCMNPMLSSRDVNPGEIASLMVPISTVNEQPGPKEFLLTVHYTDPEPRQTTLTIKAVFPRQMVVVEPKAMYLSQRTSTEIPFSIRVNDYREQKLQVTSITSTADFVAATLIQSPTTALVPTPDPIFAEPETGSIQQVGFESSESQPVSDVVPLTESESTAESTIGTSATITGTVRGNLPPGRHHVLVSAETNDPDFPIITVPMMVTGPAYPVGEDVQMTTSMIQLVASDDPRARRSGHLAFTAPADWQFAEPTVWPEQLKVSLKTSPTSVPGRASTIVQVELTELPADQLKEGVISIPTTDGKNLITAKIGFLWP